MRDHANVNARKRIKPAPSPHEKPLFPILSKKILNPHARHARAAQGNDPG
jgi:hypothetical protein